MKLFKYSYFVFVNYFWIVTVSSLLLIAFGAKQYLISMLLPIAFYALAYASRKKQNLTIFDVLIICILISDVISWAINDYRFKSTLIMRHIIGPVSYMFIYYVGRNLPVEKSYKVFKASLLPALITSVIGIYCFFFPPAWYFSIMEDGNLSSLEALRLHSIFTSPYTLAYMDTFLLGYIFFQIFQNNEQITRYKYHIAIFVITLAFCMMRAPMAGTAIYFLLALLLSCLSMGKWKKLIYAVLGVVMLSGILFTVMKNTNAQYVDFLLEKFDIVSEKNSTFVEDRYKLMEADESFFGDGAGRHNLWADDYVVGSSMRDGEYQKLMQEVGYVGQYIYIILIVLVMIKCLFHPKHLLFEFSTMAFLLIAMIGAAPLSTIDKSCFVFWLVMGRVASFKKTRTITTKATSVQTQRSIINVKI